MKTWAVTVAAVSGIVWAMADDAPQFLFIMLTIGGLVFLLWLVLSCFAFVHRSRCPRCRRQGLKILEFVHRSGCPRCQRRGLKFAGGLFDGPTFHHCQCCSARLMHHLGGDWEEADADTWATFVDGDDP